MEEIVKGEFINYDLYLSVEKFLEENGIEVESYEELPRNGVFTLVDGTKISTNGYVF